MHAHLLFLTINCSCAGFFEYKSENPIIYALSCVSWHMRAALQTLFNFNINAFRFVLIGIIAADKIELLSPTNCQFNKWVHITRIMLVGC